MMRPFAARRELPPSLPWVIMLAVSLVSLVLRGPIVALSPVIGLVRDDLALTAGQAGLLTSLPVLCFSLATPLAIAVISRAGIDAAVTACLVGVGLGTIIRSADGLPSAIVGTIVIGASITIGNVVMPVVIRRDVAPDRVNLATGVYTSALNIGSTITALGTAPIAETLGWRVALGTWIVFCLLGLIAWIVAVGWHRVFVPRARPRAGHADHVVEEKQPIWTSLTTLMLAVAFSGQAFAYYGTTAWLPTLLHDRIGYSIEAAGASASVFQIAAVIGALGVPLLISRLDAARTFVVVGVLWSTVPLGLMFAPSWWLLWCLLGGAAQGGGFTVVFVVIVRLARGGRHAATLSATVQGIGYAIAATSPTVLGFVHDIDGSWIGPMAVILVATLTFLGLGVAASVRAGRARPPSTATGPREGTS